MELRPTDADIIWRYNIFEQLDAHPHDATACSPLIYGDYLYVCTGNGINGAENKVLNPLAPSLIVLDKRTGKLVAQDDEKIGTRLFKGQWSSPSLCQVGGKTLIIYGGGDGMCYAFEPVSPPRDGNVATLEKVWAVDCIPPECRFRNGKPVAYRQENGPSEIVGTPTCAAGRIYVTIGHDPQHGEGKGNLTCIDPAKGSRRLELWPDRAQHVDRGRERRPPIRGRDLRDRPLRRCQHGPGPLDARGQRAGLGLDAGGRRPGLRAHQPRPAGLRRGEGEEAPADNRDRQRLLQFAGGRQRCAVRGLDEIFIRPELEVSRRGWEDGHRAQLGRRVPP